MPGDIRGLITRKLSRWDGKEFLVVRASPEVWPQLGYPSLNGLKGRLGKPGGLCRGSCCRLLEGTILLVFHTSSMHPAIHSFSQSAIPSGFTGNISQLGTMESDNREGKCPRLCSHGIFNSLVDTF